MTHLRIVNEASQKNDPSNVEKYIVDSETKFNQILAEVLNGTNREAHQVEISIFKQLLELGLLLLNLFFSNHNQGDYGKQINIAKGCAKRGRTSAKSYYSIFGKLEVTRYFYHIGKESFAPLDIILNLPVRCYSYFLSEMVDMLCIKEAYSEGASFLKKFFNLKLYVSAMETIAAESWSSYEDYYDVKRNIPQLSETPSAFTVVSFDGKGIPMIKKEIENIKGKQGGQAKKKESLVGVEYEINANIRTPKEVATNLVFPDEKESNPAFKEKAQNIRYIASIEQSKKEVMEEIKTEIRNQNFDESPLIVVMDGALCLWKLAKSVFQDIKSKVLILDIIHALEYIWLIANVKHPKDSKKAKQYVYEKLLMVLQGRISSYILELQNEKLGKKRKTQIKVFSKVITYFKNHKEYMKYDEYLFNGYPIGSGVVESACGHIVKDRMEISGARWGIQGSEAILKLRSVVKSNDWDNYWEFFIAQKRNNDFLPTDTKSLCLKGKLIV